MSKCFFYTKNHFFSFWSHLSLMHLQSDPKRNPRKLEQMIDPLQRQVQLVPCQLSCSVLSLSTHNDLSPPVTHDLHADVCFIPMKWCCTKTSFSLKLNTISLHKIHFQLYFATKSMSKTCFFKLFTEWKV